MNLRDHFVSAFESIFLAMIMVWSVGIAAALLNPDFSAPPQGSVEIYSLVAADTQPTA